MKEKSVTRLDPTVVSLLTETTLDVVVFTGNLDLICDTPGIFYFLLKVQEAEQRYIRTKSMPQRSNHVKKNTERAEGVVSSSYPNAPALEKSLIRRKEEEATDEDRK